MTPEPLPVELLATQDQRRLTDIDEDFDDLVVVDPHEAHAPSRRSDKDLGEFLNLLDSLETGNDRKETTR